MRFMDQREIDGAGGLSDVERAQLHEAGLRYDGADIDAETRLADGGDEESFLGFCTLWRVGEAGDVRYDAWLYMVDSGTVFRAGTTEVVAEIVQFGLECTDPAVRGDLGPAMVEAGLLPRADSAYAEFAALLEERRG
jgi:hypothetical protein